MQTRLLSLVLILGMALPATSLAQAEGPYDKGWYIGAGLAVNDVYSYEEFCLGCYGASIYGDSGAGFTLSGGLRINRYLAIEGSYFGDATMGWDEGIVFDQATLQTYLLDADIELSSWQVSVLGILAGRKWEAYVRVGLSMWNAESDQLLTPLGLGPQFQRRFDRDGEDFSLGVGLGRSFGDNWQWRFDYGYFGIDDELLGVGGSESAYSDALSLQILSRFSDSDE